MSNLRSKTQTDSIPINTVGVVSKNNNQVRVLSDTTDAHSARHIMLRTPTEKEIIELARTVWDIPLPPELEGSVIYDGCDQMTFPVPEGILADSDALELFCSTVEMTTIDLISGNEKCKTCRGFGFVTGRLESELCDACLRRFATRWEKKLKVKGVCEVCKKNIDGRHSLVRSGNQNFHWNCKPEGALLAEHYYCSRKGTGYVQF